MEEILHHFLSIRGQVIQHHNSLIPATPIETCALWTHACRANELRSIPSYINHSFRDMRSARDMLSTTSCIIECLLDDKYSLYPSMEPFPLILQVSFFCLQSEPLKSLKSSLYAFQILDQCLKRGQAIESLDKVKQKKEVKRQECTKLSLHPRQLREPFLKPYVRLNASLVLKKLGIGEKSREKPTQKSNSEREEKNIFWTSAHRPAGQIVAQTVGQSTCARVCGPTRAPAQAQARVAFPSVVVFARNLARDQWQHAFVIAIRWLRPCPTRI